MVGEGVDSVMHHLAEDRLDRNLSESVCAGGIDEINETRPPESLISIGRLDHGVSLENKGLFGIPGARTFKLNESLDRARHDVVTPLESGMGFLDVFHNVTETLKADGSTYNVSILLESFQLVLDDVIDRHN